MSDPTSLSGGPTSLCARFRPLLALLRTGALSPREAAALNEHISSCFWCQRELATYDALDAAARQHLAGATFRPLTLEDIMYAANLPPDANATSTLGARHKIGPALRRQSSLSSLGPLAAVVVLALLAGVIFATHRLGAGVSPGGKPTPSAPTPTANLTQTTWILTHLIIDGHEQQLVPTLSGHAPDVVFSSHNGQYYGMGSCNTYGGTYTISGDSLHLSSLYYTQVACRTQALTEQENVYFQALPHVERYHLDGNTLTLASTDGSVRLTFQAS